MANKAIEHYNCLLFVLKWLAKNYYDFKSTHTRMWGVNNNYYYYSNIYTMRASASDVFYSGTIEYTHAAYIKGDTENMLIDWLIWIKRCINETDKKKTGPIKSQEAAP